LRRTCGALEPDSRGPADVPELALYRRYRADSARVCTA